MRPPEQSLRSSALDEREQWSDAIAPYLRLWQAHWRLIVLTAVVALAASAAWLAIRPTTYQATSKILVSAVPEGQSELAGLPLVRDSAREPVRAVSTAASLLESRAAAGLTARRLGRGLSGDEVESDVSIEPQSDSDFVEVKASESSPELAAAIANAYAAAALDLRKARLRPQVAQALRDARLQLDVLDRRRGDAASSLQLKIAALALLPAGDPALSISERAEVPSTPQQPPAWLVLAIAGIAGLSIGMVAAVLVELLVVPPTEQGGVATITARRR